MEKLLVDQIGVYGESDLPIVTEVELTVDDDRADPPRFRLFEAVFDGVEPGVVRVRLEPLPMPEQGEYFRVYSDNSGDNFHTVDIETRFTSSREKLIGRVARMGVNAQPTH